LENIALKALDLDGKRNQKISTASNLLRRIRKVGGSGESFRALAQSYFSFATYFK
jgi:hypothetical protein